MKSTVVKSIASLSTLALVAIMMIAPSIAQAQKANPGPGLGGVVVGPTPHPNVDTKPPRGPITPR